MGGRPMVALAAVAGSLAMAGCWPQPGAGPANDFHNPFETTISTGTVASLAPVWESRVQVSAVQGGRAVGEGPSTTEADVVMLDAATGSELWARSLGSDEMAGLWTTAAPVFVGEEVWASWYGDRYDPTTGLTCDGGIERLDVATGASGVPVTRDWTALVMVPFGDGVAQLVNSSQQHCTGMYERPVQVVDTATGAVRWQTDDGIRPLIVGDELVQPGPNGVPEGYRLDGCGAPRCDPAWTIDVETPRLSAGGDGRLFGLDWDPATGTDRLTAMDRSTRTVSWRWTLPRRESQGVAVTPEVVYVSSAQDVMAFDAAGCGGATCPPLWRGRVSGRSTAVPIVAGDLVWTGSLTGAVQAFPAAGCGTARCQPLVTRQVGAPVTHLLVSGGRLLAVTADGTTAFAVPST